MNTSETTPFLKDPAGQEHLLSGELITIGRAIECDIVITGKRVSREHTRVRREGWRVILEDLNSTNGTYLNDERVLAPVQLRDGDRLGIGGVALVFHDLDVTHRDQLLPELELDLAAATVRVNRQPVSLTHKEYLLLTYLFERRGQVCSKDDIGESVWPEYKEGVFDYQVENLVRRLRIKLEPDPGEPQLLVTVRGLGYKLVPVN